MAGSYDADKIELGAGNLKIKVLDSGPEVYVGGTLGAEFAYTPEMKDIEVDQTMAPITTVMIGEEGTLKVTILENTMRNLVIALGMDPDADITGTAATPETVEFGGKHSPVWLYLTYFVEQTADTAEDWIVYLYKARVTSGLTLPFSKEEERRFEVTFTAYANVSGKLGKIERTF